jgi:hypothetical protein
VGCAFCGGGDRWIKTCLTADGSRMRVCDPCYGARASELVIVPGDWIVTARCDSCGTYGNPRDFEDANPGGRKGVYSGTCGACAREDTGSTEGAVEDAARTDFIAKEIRRWRRLTTTYTTIEATGPMEASAG